MSVQGKRGVAPHRVKLTISGNNLGIVIVGGTHVQSADGDFGIFIKHVIPGGLAESDGQLHVGDQLLEVNGVTLVGVSNNRAVEIMKASTATGEVDLLVARDDNTQEQFKKLSSSLMSNPLQVTPPIERREHYRSTSSLGTVSETSTQDSGDILDDETVNAVSVAVKTVLGAAAATAAASTATRSDQVNISDIPVSLSESASPTDEVDRAPPPLPTCPPPLTPDKVATDFADYPTFNFESPAVPTSAAALSKLTVAHKPPPTDIYHLPPVGAQQRRPRIGQTSGTQLNRRWSVDSDYKVKLEKLEWALQYVVGTPLTQEQKNQLRRSLDIDKDGRVTYGDFVQLVQNMFPFHLEDSQQQQLALALSEKLTMDIPQIPKIPPKPVSPLSTGSTQLAGLTSSSPSDSPATMDAWEQEMQMEQLKTQVMEASEKQQALREEKHAAQREVAELKALLREKETRCAELEEAVQISKQERRLAEAEVESYKRTPQKTVPMLLGGDIQRKLAVKSCELRKAEFTIRRYKVATEKLLQFVEDCHDTLVHSPGANTILYHRQGAGESVVRGDPISGNPRPPPYLSNHAKITATKLAQEAKETVVAVRKILNVQELPYGWEEQRNEEGERYYVNHQEQKTSWERPQQAASSFTSPTRVSGYSSPTGHVTKP